MAPQIHLSTAATPWSIPQTGVMFDEINDVKKGSVAVQVASQGLWLESCTGADQKAT